MAAVGTKLRSGEGNRLTFFCPGCKDTHDVVHGEGHWNWNGDGNKPTFAPSVLVRSGHYSTGKPNGKCWCTWNAEQAAAGKEPSDFKCYLCHSFVEQGRIRFLTDSTHELAGQTVDLPDFPIGENA